ncbi:MAG: DUF2177 family protein [Bdellovibrionales bacterium]|nr:DUF2177 family protein [Bdellovibrionales bacterium]
MEKPRQLVKLRQFFVALVLFAVFDFFWLGFVMKDFNMRQLAEIGRIENGIFQMYYPAALATYLLMALAVPLYVLPKLTRQDSLLKVFSSGAILGLIIYGVFDMTNLSILKDYPLAFVAPDIAWGAFIFGLVSVLTLKMERQK